MLVVDPIRSFHTLDVDDRLTTIELQPAMLYIFDPLETTDTLA
jgi:hypothetical protein